MKIVKLVAENFKRLRAVEITPTGELVLVTGKNDQGKSSVLDGIWAALKMSEHAIEKPVREGEEKARIRLEMGEITVERRFTAAGGTSLMVINADGAVYQAPQKVLDGLMSHLSFDPLKFSRMKPKEASDELRRVANVAYDFDAAKVADKTDYDKRTEVNRQEKLKRAQADGMPQNLPPKVDVSALSAEIEKATTHNADIERRKANRERAQQDIANYRVLATKATAEAERLRTMAATFDVEASGHTRSAAELDAQLKSAGPLPEPIDATPVRAQLAAADGINQAHTELATKQTALKEADELKAQADVLTAAMGSRAMAREKAVKEAKMPVEGLGLGDEIVTYNGVPLAQVGKGERLRISCAIVMAGNPKIKVIRIEEGSDLDSDHLRMIAEMAKEKDYQVWIERVDETGKVGVVIEDGNVKAVN